MCLIEGGAALVCLPVNLPQALSCWEFEARQTFWGCGGGVGAPIRCHLNLSSLGLSAGRSLDGGGKLRGLRFL